jgi:hypothetical protein
MRSMPTRPNRSRAKEKKPPLMLAQRLLSFVDFIGDQNVIFFVRAND